ncbi:protein DEEPER ROOTING 1-like [Salvia divinorum]|uniref:Protein DEEPER ROOTING 1-like n=1 Tax=Salvia divinorum TaxID=28513 RepID=A0ABD1IH17_SALDI
MSLLSIGTFGNKIEDSDTTETPADDQLEQGFERELRALLNKHASNSSGESEHFDLPMEKMLESFPVDGEEEDNELVAEKQAALVERANSRGKDRKGKGSIYRKSISFLLRKAFVCAPPPILRDPFLDANLDRSRMEKIMKTVLRKKKHPQRQKYLNNNRTANEEEKGETSNPNNWVKTDSECKYL